MVKHQCRYCSMLVTVNGVWCGRTQEAMDESATKRRNDCPFYEFCEIDAWGERDWETDGIAMSPLATEPEGQMRLELCI